MIKIKQAWYVKQLPQHIVAEMPNGEFKMFSLQPFRKVGEDELLNYKGLHPHRCTSDPVPSYILKHYGVEAELLPPTRATGLSTLEAEREYNLPEGTIRRDIHRGRFEEHEYQKVGRGWIVSREGIERLYVKEKANENDRH